MRMGELAGLGENSRGSVHLRVRSAYSLLEGAIKADKIGGLARADGMPAVAIADRANLFGALEFSVATKDAGVQPIIGCALPVSGIGEVPPERWAKTPTVVLLAQSEQGYLNLSQLSSIAFLEVDAADEPHVPWARVCEFSDGLLLLSGGPDGPVDHLFAGGKAKEGRAALAEMKHVKANRIGAARMGRLRYRRARSSATMDSACLAAIGNHDTTPQTRSRRRARTSASRS